jgi:enoyl-CoA hydratase/carnithine racemase
MGDARPGIHTSDDGRVRTVVMDRPGRKNALDQAMWLGLRDALEAAAIDDGISVVVLTGAGDAFTAGQDLGELRDPEAFGEQVPGFVQLMPVVERFPKPLVAAVNGVGVGIGLTILLHCDLVLVADEARVRAPFISLGVTTEASASVLLPAIVGPQEAARILVTEPWLDGAELVRLGIALRSVPRAELAGEAAALAASIAALPLASILATKRLLIAGRIDAITAAREREVAEFEHLVQAMLAD